MEGGNADSWNLHGIAAGLLKCLKECPTGTRKDLIANILVCGDIPMLVPDLGRLLALKVKDLLLGTGKDFAETTEQFNHERKMQAATFVPLATKELKALQEHVGVLSCSPHRADLISWVGGSVYSSMCLDRGE